AHAVLLRLRPLQDGGGRPAALLSLAPRADCGCAARGRRDGGRGVDRPRPPPPRRLRLVPPQSRAASRRSASSTAASRVISCARPARLTSRTRAPGASWIVQPAV